MVVDNEEPVIKSLRCSHCGADVTAESYEIMDKKDSKISANDIEIAVAGLINYRQHVIVPNVSWGLGLRHECDILILDDQNRFTEVEIKISKSDLLADFKKSHGHRSKIISRLVYAVPEFLLPHTDIIPKHNGIIVVKSEWIAKPGYWQRTALWKRQCRHKVVETPTPHTIRKFMELGCMRIWTLKQHLKRKQF